ncbi:hypothetical protein, partial [Streptomyces katrae]|uniref:hypothetical protein n=1 Tax=Streptomyces katrae TaxID=68223 RepID=UPI001B804DB6
MIRWTPATTNSGYKVYGSTTEPTKAKPGRLMMTTDGAATGATIMLRSGSLTPAQVRYVVV